MKFEDYKQYVISTITIERETLLEESAWRDEAMIERLDMLVQLRKAEAATTCDQLTDIMEAIH